MSRRRFMNYRSAKGIIIEEFTDDGRPLKVTIIPQGTSLSGYIMGGGGSESSSYWGKLEEIVLPENVTSIGVSSFAGCFSLKTINLPDSLTNISTSAFANCKLGTLVIPASVKTIGTTAFKNGDLDEVTFKGTPASIGTNAFQSTGVKTINVPWSEGAVSGAPWGASGAAITYNYKEA